MRRGLVGLLALFVLAACTEEVPSGTGPDGVTPAQATSPVHIGDLTGRWVIGSNREPGAGPVVACEPDQTLQIYQEGEVIHGDVAVCGGGECRTLEAFEGVNRYGAVQLDGRHQGNQMDRPEEVSYRLTFDAKTQHLVGTRNGQRFWAAPWVQKAGCPTPRPSPAVSVRPASGK